LINVNSRDAIVNGYLLMEQECELSGRLNVALPEGSRVLVPNSFAFKTFPLNRMIQQLTLRFGNTTVSSTVGELLPALEKCFTKAETRDLEYGLSINQPDKYKYASQSILASNSPFNPYNVGGYAEGNTRASHPIRVLQNDTQNFRVRTTLREPLWISPLVQSLRERCGGFTHLTSIEVIIQWANDGNRMFSFYNQSVQGSLAASTCAMSLTFPTNPVLYVNQLVDPLMIPPAITYYNYSEISNRYTTDFVMPTGVAGAEVAVSVSSQTLQLDRIPRYVMIWATRNQNALRYWDNSSFAPINKVSINFNNVNYCSEHAIPVIYANSVKNGLNVPFLDWSGQATGAPTQIGSVNVAPVVLTNGAPLIYKFGEEIPLSNQLSIGCSTKVNFSATVEFANKDGLINDTSQVNVPFTMYIAFLSDQSLSLFGSNTGQITSAPISELNVLQAQASAPEINPKEEGDSFGGASGMGWLSNYITSGKLKRHIKMARDVAPLVSFGTHMVKKGLKSSGSKTARMTADAIHALQGYGEGEGEGGELVGNGGMSKAQLRKRLLG
jgi:hypothetical protein